MTTRISLHISTVLSNAKLLTTTEWPAEKEMTSVADNEAIAVVFDIDSKFWICICSLCMQIKWLSGQKLISKKIRNSRYIKLRFLVEIIIKYLW